MTGSYRGTTRAASRIRKGLLIAAVGLGGYALLAYVVLPSVWTHYEHQRGLAGRPMVTHTKQGIPGGPLNVGLVGSHEDIVRAMHAAGWFPADPITLRSSIGIIGSVLLHRPDDNAPVSPLFYQGRQEDLAFEKPVGSSADQRHHVRFWKIMDSGDEDRPVWLGSVTFDRSVGLSRYTAQVTHHIAPDIDAERDHLINDLVRAGMVTTRYQVSGVGPTLNGRNGEGDPYYTDGEIWMAVLVVAGEKRSQPPTELANSALVTAKDGIWNAVASTLGN
ncbi:LssY C-terminal domain-containing protein [Microvirga sp. BT689]|uniref:LssY C-terminal domain-containing protein n=1 Tax=Microvirga arvi TaxID=2778731 RepID=UPI0019519089|nr:LssY C-terminal domain-containing protein [Microvirga arvi]MBM6582247.1 LssY C-terminal domain-containing protein [Microvirga arvi]